MSAKQYLLTQEILNRYRISKTTLLRWEKDQKLSLPKPLWISGRKLYPLDEIEAWERQRAGASRGRAA